MVETKSASSAADSWESAIGQVPARYQEGVRAAQNVISRSIDAEDIWADAMRAAIDRRARAAGLQGISDQDWRNASLNKGSQRIGQGMRASVSKFQNQISKVLDVLSGIDLPARTTDVATNVQNRVTPVASGLREAKREGRFA